MAAYYGAPIGLALKAALPAGLWGSSEVIVEVAAAGRVPGGTGAEILRWLERKGGSASVGAIGRALKRSVWDAVDRLARVGAVTLRIEPPDTGGGAVSERVLVLPRDRPTLLERKELFGGTPRQRTLYEALEQLGGAAPVDHLRTQLGFGSALMRALVTRGLARIDEVERAAGPLCRRGGHTAAGRV